MSLDDAVVRPKAPRDAMMDDVPLAATRMPLPTPRPTAHRAPRRRSVGWAARLSALGLAAALPLAGILAVAATPAAAAPAPIVIDDFSGTTAGPRSVTGLPRPGESTQAPGTFTESGGVATMTMGGSGNRPGGVELDYTLPHLDLTSQGSNTQFFLVFDSISRSGVDAWLPAATVSIELTGGGITGVYTTQISTTGAFNIVLNFSCAANPACFSPQPDFTDVTQVKVSFLYPQSHEAAANTTTIALSSINTTPTGGAVPPAPTATLTAPADPYVGPRGTTIDFPLQFLSGGSATRVYSSTTAGPLSVGDVAVTGTAAGVGSYSLVPDGLGYIVRVGPLTSGGTVSVSVPAGVAVDAWAQESLASTAATTLFVVPVPPAFTSPAPPAATVGAAYTHRFTADGVPAPVFAVESGALPAGLTLATDGTLTGTPAAGSGGIYPVAIRASNSAGSATAAVTLVVDQAPEITSADTAAFVAGTPSDFTITADGFPRPHLSLTGTLPAGLTFTDHGDGTAGLSGDAAATATGTTDVTVWATSAAGSAQQTLRISVQSPPVFTGSLAADLLVATPASFTVTAAGDPVPSISAAGPLPAGLLLTDNGDGTATLSGTPAVPGVTNVALHAQNALGSDDATLAITVRQAPVITSPDSAILIVGTPGTFTVTATGIPAAAITVDGTLPGGVAFADNGDGTATVSGTPEAGSGGDYALTVSARVAGLAPAVQEFTLKVKQEPVFTSPSSATFVAGQPGSFTVVTEAVPTAWLELVGTLPPGLTFVDNGDGTATISGTPAIDAVGTYSVTVNATNDLVDPPQTLTIVVSQPVGGGTPSAGGAGSPGAPTSALPATGADAPWVPAALAAALLVTGCAVIFSVRRRRSSV